MNNLYNYNTYNRDDGFTTSSSLNNNFYQNRMVMVYPQIKNDHNNHNLPFFGSFDFAKPSQGLSIPCQNPEQSLELNVQRLVNNDYYNNLNRNYEKSHFAKEVLPLQYRAQTLSSFELNLELNVQQLINDELLDSKQDININKQNTFNSINNLLDNNNKFNDSLKSNTTNLVNNAKINSSSVILLEKFNNNIKNDISVLLVRDTNTGIYKCPGGIIKFDDSPLKNASEKLMDLTYNLINMKIYYQHVDVTMINNNIHRGYIGFVRYKYDNSYNIHYINTKIFSDNLKIFNQNPSLSKIPKDTNYLTRVYISDILSGYDNNRFDHNQNLKIKDVDNSDIIIDKLSIELIKKAFSDNYIKINKNQIFPNVPLQFLRLDNNYKSDKCSIYNGTQCYYC